MAMNSIYSILPAGKEEIVMYAYATNLMTSRIPFLELNAHNLTREAFDRICVFGKMTAFTSYSCYGPQQSSDPHMKAKPQTKS